MQTDDPYAVTPGLLAPQFGLGQRSSSDFLSEAPRPRPQLTQSSGPTVVVKRRRLLEHAAVPSEPEASVVAVKTSKVYQVGKPSSEQDADSATAATTQVVEPSADTTPAPKSTRLKRRRRNEAHKPVLLQHLVFEPPPVDRSLFSDLVPQAEIDRMQAALVQIRQDLEVASSAQRISSELEQMLARFG
jgi:hypothetical protein